MKKLFPKLVLLAILVACSAFISAYRDKFGFGPALYNTSPGLTDLGQLKDAFENQISNFQVRQSGRIIKILRDDVHIPRHQRFVVELSSGQKILVAHNIDLAPKVVGLMEGLGISFCGEYEWNNKGGVVHWTHHDPKGIHPNGWLLYNNKKYD